MPLKIFQIPREFFKQFSSCKYDKYDDEGIEVNIKNFALFYNYIKNIYKAH